MSNPLLKTIGNRIREIRQKREMTIEDCADRCDIHATYLNQIELGQRSVSVEVLYLT